MPSTFESLARRALPWLAASALASWGAALWQAVPRLSAGPLCSARQDAFALAGHCPACFVAAFLTLAFLASLLARRESRVAIRVRA
jgi:hypothetical protein